METKERDQFGIDPYLENMIGDWTRGLYKEPGITLLQLKQMRGFIATTEPKLAPGQWKELLTEIQKREEKLNAFDFKKPKLTLSGAYDFSPLDKHTKTNYKLMTVETRAGYSEPKPANQRRRAYKQLKEAQKELEALEVKQDNRQQRRHWQSVIEGAQKTLNDQTVMEAQQVKVQCQSYIDYYKAIQGYYQGFIDKRAELLTDPETITKNRELYSIMAEKRQIVKSRDTWPELPYFASSYDLEPEKNGQRRGLPTLRDIDVYLYSKPDDNNSMEQELKNIIGQLQQLIDYYSEISSFFDNLLEVKTQEAKGKLEKYARVWGSLISRVGRRPTGKYKAYWDDVSGYAWPPLREYDFDRFVELFGKEELNIFTNEELPAKYRRTAKEEAALMWLT